MRSGFTQAGRMVTVATPFGADDLLVDAVQGSEGLSELFDFTVSMRSGNPGLDPADLSLIHI